MNKKRHATAPLIGSYKWLSISRNILFYKCSFKVVAISREREMGDAFFSAPFVSQI